MLRIYQYLADWPHWGPAPRPPLSRQVWYESHFCTMDAFPIIVLREPALHQIKLSTAKSHGGVECLLAILSRFAQAPYVISHHYYVKAN